MSAPSKFTRLSQQVLLANTERERAARKFEQFNAKLRGQLSKAEERMSQKLLDEHEAARLKHEKLEREMLDAHAEELSVTKGGAQ